ncbi:sulfatase-like hydrolase/transferase [Paenibacillus sp. FJAT-27812]|uniref:sulfatase-like hydrolase/transferase n=1 Tax=Paenibacillus sp. FJAT-27812 TaxID=1684143 RepID=UPI0006A7A162|nr:sulfatase-like hydrolase/transferase [Paenibacillus sp. FJAT-27812]
MRESTLQQPNIIVFFTDQQRWDTTGVHGNPLGLTPNLDRMAVEGTHLYNSFTSQPVCGPARSCLQTGLYATSTGSYRNGIPLAHEHRTLAHYFKDAGYKTGYIGKWHLSKHEPVPVEDRGGYDEWLASNLLELSSDAYQTMLYDNDGQEVHLPGYRVDALTDAAIRYIDRCRKDPFFLFISYLEPHHQNHSDNYPAPVGYEGKYIDRWTPPDLRALGGSSAQHLGGYYGMVKRLDEALGRLMDTLISLKLSDNTIILFTSDHGCHFKTRNGEYKRSAHESSIRVPSALYGPGFMGGGQIRKLVSLVDLPPTLLDAAGIQVPAHMQGRSVLPLVRGASSDWPDEAYVQISETQIGRAIRTERWKYAVAAPGKNGWEEAHSDVYVEELLYDLYSDPYELDNLAGIEAYRHIADDLKERLLKKMKEINEPTAIIEPAARVVGYRRPELRMS